MTIQAGRELDAEVAEKIFGLVIRDTFTEDEKPITASQVLGIVGSRVSIPQFSTDITAAFQVVDKLATKNIHLRLSNSSDKKWKAAMLKGQRWVAEVIDDNPATAICRAAIVAVDYPGGFSD